MNQETKVKLYPLQPSGQWNFHGNEYVTITQTVTKPATDEGVSHDSPIYAQLGHPKKALSNYSSTASKGKLLNVKIALDRSYTGNELELVWGEPIENGKSAVLKLEFETMPGISHIQAKIKEIQDKAKVSEKCCRLFQQPESKQ
eukprot:scaffold154722_cov36-Cyclotella_meneghiniana.AAC.6